MLYVIAREWFNGRSVAGTHQLSNSSTMQEVPMPIIAVTPNRKLPDYEESVRRAGGTPRVLDLASDSPADVVASIDALLLTGGGDVLPSLYGAVQHPAFDAAEPGRDEYEIELVRRALEADLPVLAICRGIQVLNVARGGTL